MEKLKIGIYSVLESTANNKVEDLYVIVDDQSICFVVKNIHNGQFIAFEYVEDTPDQKGWNQHLAYLQNNSKLIQAYYRQVLFVMNTKRALLSKFIHNSSDTFYQNEFSLLMGLKMDEELQLQSIGQEQVLIYSIPDALNTLLTRAFPRGKWFHYTGSLIASNLGGGVCISVFNDYFILLIIQKGKPLLLNYFNRGGDHQNQYLVLNACVQANTLPKQTNLKVIGYSAERDLWMQELATHFANANVQQVPDAGIGTAINTQYPDHHFAPYFIF